MPELLLRLDWLNLASHSAPMLIFLGAAVLMLLFSAARDISPLLSGLLAILGFGASIWLSWLGWPSAFGEQGFALSFDRLSIIAWMIIAAAGIICTLLSIPYLTSKRTPGADYFSLLLLAAFGMAVLVAASNILVALIALEIMSLSAYALTGFLRERASSLEGALKYFLMGAFASTFFAMGIAFLLGSTGSTDFSLIASRARDIAGGEGRVFFLFGSAMVMVGFAFKVALVPFHAWAPDAYDGAPTPVTSFMATAIKACAFIAFIRFASAVAPAMGILWHHLISALAAATMIFGNLAAIRQDNLKRMLAYSSIAHAGYLMVALPSLAANPEAQIRTTLFYLISYVAMTSGAFAAVTAVGMLPGEPVDIGKLSGLSRKRPVLAAAFSLFLFSLAGFPPTMGFFGKYYLFQSAVNNGDLSLVVIAVLTSVVSVYYYLRPIVVMYFRGAEREALAEPIPMHAEIVAVVAITAMAVIIFGIIPQDILSLVQNSVR